MPKVGYRPYNPKDGAIEIIAQVNEIIEEYQEMGLSMTLRQLYYQFVARDLFANTLNNYNRLKTILGRARLAGMVDWEAIEDRTRDVQKNSHWDSPASIVRACADQYAVDKWEGQQYQPEVWIEKQALIGVIEEPCEDLDVPFAACKGYSSLSTLWRAGNRMLEYLDDGRTPVILYLGDHDPSGLHMPRAIESQLAEFLAHHRRGDSLVVQQVALTMAQVEQYGPPPNVAKETDARYATYQAEFGDVCWELDALSPPVLVELVRSAVLHYRDDDEWDTCMEAEVEGRRQLRQIAQRWGFVTARLEELAEEEAPPELSDDVDDEDDEDEDEDEE
jgi:hypothetical protein